VARRAACRLRTSRPTGCITQETSTPICTGENIYLAHGFRRLLEIGGVDIIMPDLQKAGGLGEGQRIANLANLYYVPFAPHMVASYLGAMAACHVCASVPNFMILEWQIYFHKDEMFKEIVTFDGPMVEKGFITLSEKPGIGVEINEEGMRKYAVPGVPFFVQFLALPMCREDLALACERFPDERARGVLADVEIAPAVVGHAVALVARIAHLDHTFSGLQRRRMSLGMSLKYRHCSLGFQIGPSLKRKPVHTCSTSAWRSSRCSSSGSFTSRVSGVGLMNSSPSCRANASEATLEAADDLLR
jgi:hypothetical protein